jgi:integrase
LQLAFLFEQSAERGELNAVVVFVGSRRHVDAIDVAGEPRVEFGDGQRSTPVSEFIMDRLAEHIRMKALVDHIFVRSRNCSVMRNRTFRRYWYDEAAEAIGIPGLTLHELRLTCASLAVSVGAIVKTVQFMLGHASAAIALDVYADLFEDDLDDVGEALNTAAASSLATGSATANVSESE